MEHNIFLTAFVLVVCHESTSLPFWVTTNFFSKQPQLPQLPQDVNFSVCQSALQVGKIIGVSLMMQNTGTEERTIEITLSLYTSYYTGISKHKVKTENYTVILGPLSSNCVCLQNYTTYTTSRKSEQNRD